MSVSKAEITRQNIKLVRDGLIAGTDIERKEFTITETKMRGRKAYAIECREPETLQQLFDNAIGNYIVERLSRIVIVLYPKVQVQGVLNA